MSVTTDYVAKDGVIGGLSDGVRAADAGVRGGEGRGSGVRCRPAMALRCSRWPDIKPAHAPDFAEYKAHILDDYREQKVPQLLSAQMNKLADRAKVLNDLKKAAAEMNVPVKSSDLVGKDGQVPDLGAMSGPGSVAFSLAEGSDLGADQCGSSGRGAERDRQAGADGGRHCEELRPDARAAAERQREEIFRVYIGNADGEVREGRRRCGYSKKPAGSGRLRSGAR